MESRILRWAQGKAGGDRRWRKKSENEEYGCSGMKEVSSGTE